MRTQSIMVPFMVLGTGFVPTVFATCYYSNGSVDSVFNQLPCDPTADVSACCARDDFCLSNGLCFDAGANNLLAVQGCTDPKWSSPCHPYCPNEIELGNNLFPCANTEPSGGGSVEYCCGHVATDVSTCCANGGAFSVPVGQIILRAYQIASYLALSTPISATSVSTPSTPSTPSTTNPILSISSSPPTQSSSGSSANNKALSIGLGVGLGLGISFLLLLIGAVVFLGLQLKRQNQNRAPLDGASPVASGIMPMTGSYHPRVEIMETQRTRLRSELDSAESTSV